MLLWLVFVFEQKCDEVHHNKVDLLAGYFIDFYFLINLVIIILSLLDLAPQRQVEIIYSVILIVEVLSFEILKHMLQVLEHSYPLTRTTLLSSYPVWRSCASK
jgi:hypothetical protein